MFVPTLLFGYRRRRTHHLSPRLLSDPSSRSLHVCDANSERESENSRIVNLASVNKGVAEISKQLLLRAFSGMLKNA